MAIGTPVNIGSDPFFSASTTVVMTVDAAVSAGDKVIVFVGSETAGTTLTEVVDSRGNTYAVDATANATQNAAAFVASSEVTTSLQIGDTITATYSASRSRRFIAAISVSGLADSGAFDKSAGANGTTLAWSTGATPTTTQADELVVGCCLSNASSTPTNTPDAPLVEVHDISNADAVGFFTEYRIVSATGAYTVSGLSTGGALVWNAAAATYKAQLDPPSPGGKGTLGQFDPHLRRDAWF